MTEPVVISRSPKAVQDFTQDQRRRKIRGTSVREVTVDGVGSWMFAAPAAGGQWTATNTLLLTSGLWPRWLVPLFRHRLARSTRRAMQRARKLFEREAR